MKTTIKTHTKDIEVKPNAGVGGYVDLTLWGEKDPLGFREASGVSLSLDQAGALIFALEQAAEAAQLKADCLKALA
jgi:hypothetical protein